MRILVATLVLLALSTPARADVVHPPATADDHELAWAATAAGGFAWIASETVLKPRLAPHHCRWCGAPAIDRTTRDLVLRQRSAWLADAASSGLAFVVAPLLDAAPVLLSSGTWSRAADDALPIAETVVATALVDQVSKFAFARARPRGGDDLDANVSFFSGHTALAFGLAVSAGLVADRRDYAVAPLVWGGGLALAGAVGYLRIAADEHYLTDVLVGAAVGTGVACFFATRDSDTSSVRAVALPIASGAF